MEGDGGAALGSVRQPPLLGNGGRKGPEEGAPRLLLQGSKEGADASEF